MILSDGDIRRRLEAGDLVIEPLDDPDLQIQPASVDFRLGREFLEFQRTNISCIHPESADEVDEYVSRTHVPPEDQATLEGFDGDSDVNRVDDEFILHPGDFVLGTTMERVEIPDDLIAHVEGRSSLGRLAIVVHASLPYDEEVFLWTPEDGFGFYPIGDIVEKQRAAWAVSFDPRTLRVRTHRVTDYITNPVKRIFRVTLDSGRQVNVTRDHNLFTLDGHGRVTRVASEAAEGVPVMVPKQLPSSPGEHRFVDVLDHLDPSETTLYASDGMGAVDWKRVPRGSRRKAGQVGGAPMEAVSRLATPDDVEVAFKESEYRVPREIPISPELGWVLGFYIAKGSARRNEIRISDTDRVHVERFAAYFEAYDAALAWAADDGLRRLTVCSALWARIFRELAGARSPKIVPATVFDWPRPALEGLFEGLLDGTGCRREGRDTLHTQNEDLVNRVMYLAARLGKQAVAFSPEREIHPPMSDDNHEVAPWCVDVSSERHRRGESLPAPGELLRGMRESAGMCLADAAEAMGFSVSSVSNVEKRGSATVPRRTLRRFRDAYAEAGVDTTRVDQLLDGDVGFDTVVSVEATDRVETTYDLEVQPDGRAIENFLGGRGGVFLSNTAGIVDPGYRGQITLELSNLGSAPVALKPGMRISQLTFTELKNPAERPYGTERGSKYQDQTGPQASRIQGDDEFHTER